MSLPSILAGLRLPVMAAPMLIVSGPELVIAECKAGIAGSFPALNARPQELLGDWLDQIDETLAKHDANHPDRPAAPYAVNLIVHRSNDRLQQDLATVVEHRVPIVVTSLGAQREVNDAIHSYGGIVLHDVVSDRFARKAVAKGADGLVAVAAGAGGHGGVQSPFALVQEIRAWFDGPLLLSGAIANGRSVLAARALGADLAYIGSAFIATEEARAVPAYKQMVLDAHAADVVYSDLFSGVPANYLRQSIAAAGLDPDHLESGSDSVARWRDPANQAKAWRDVWGAGHGVGAITAVKPLHEMVEQFAAEFHAARHLVNELP